MFEIHQGDCLNVLRTMPTASIDSVVTDPPYGISFNGNKWDADVPSVDVWAECLRVLKPGGHLLAFAGTRTQHRMADRIEQAGFEIRDMIAWCYSSGFPKSRDVSKQMEQHQSGERPEPEAASIRPGVYEVTAFLKAARDRAGWTNKQIDALFGTKGMAGHWTSQGSQPLVPSLRQWEILRQSLGFGTELDSLVASLAGKEKGTGTSSGSPRFLGAMHGRRDFAPAGDWGTALKPSLEPITMARKAIVGSTSGNVLAFGTGALNVSRIDGRWPGNLIHDGSSEMTDAFGSAVRFFYSAKASQSDRGEDNTHPTVKPTALMRHLCRLVTPPGGLVLDPFTGSGSTGKAAVLEGFRFIGCELSAEFVDIAKRRIQQAANDNDQQALAV